MSKYVGQGDPNTHYYAGLRLDYNSGNVDGKGTYMSNAYLTSVKNVTSYPIQNLAQTTGNRNIFINYAKDLTELDIIGNNTIANPSYITFLTYEDWTKPSMTLGINYNTSNEATIELRGKSYSTATGWLLNIFNNRYSASDAGQIIYLTKGSLYIRNYNLSATMVTTSIATTALDFWTTSTPKNFDITITFKNIDAVSTLITLYLDGVYVNSTTVNWLWYWNDRDTAYDLFGQYNKITGIGVNAYRVYNRALTSEEVLQNYNAGAVFDSAVTKIEKRTGISFSDTIFNAVLLDKLKLQAVNSYVAPMQNDIDLYINKLKQVNSYVDVFDAEVITIKDILNVIKVDSFIGEIETNITKEQKKDSTLNSYSGIVTDNINLTKLSNITTDSFMSNINVAVVKNKIREIIRNIYGNEFDVQLNITKNKTETILNYVNIINSNLDIVAVLQPKDIQVLVSAHVTNKNNSVVATEKSIDTDIIDKSIGVEVMNKSIDIEKINNVVGVI